MSQKICKDFSHEELLSILQRLRPNDPIKVLHNQDIRVGNKHGLSVRVPGIYTDFGGGGESGFIITLIMKELNIDKKAAWEWTGAESIAPAGQRREKGQKRIKKDNHEWARRVWDKALPIKGTLGEKYFREHRKITCELPKCLRYTLGEYDGVDCGVIVAIVVGNDRNFLGVHRIFIDLQTGKKIGIKKSLGPIAGGAIRLSPMQDKLYLAEGIEDALSVLCIQAGLCVWACCGTSGLEGVIVPQHVREVIIIADNDGPGQSTAKKKQDMLLKLGLKVGILSPPSDYKDFNDYLRAENK